MRFATFPLHLSKVQRLPRKSDARSHEVLHLSCKNHLSKPEDLKLQNAAPPRKSVPRPPNISGEHVSCTAPATRNSSFQILFKCPTPAAIVWGKATKTLTLCSFDNVQNPLHLPHQTASERPKMVRDHQFLTLLTWKCASRHNGVHFFDAATSKSGPELTCFVHFDFQTCFAPQRRAIFHLSSGQMAPHPPL